MIDLKSDLQQVFGGVVDHLLIKSDYNPTYVMGSWSPQTTLDPMYTVTFNLFKPLDMPDSYATMMNTLHALTKTAMIRSCNSNYLIDSMYTVHTIEIVVYNLEQFSQDVKDYHWKKYNEEFTGQLDSLLEKE